ncbi:hypothetical protein ACTWQJ_18210 [Streptomyces sp. KR55]
MIGHERPEVPRVERHDIRQLQPLRHSDPRSIRDTQRKAHSTIVDSLNAAPEG